MPHPRRPRRRSRSLGAVTGERAEYRLSSSLFSEITGYAATSGVQAACDADLRRLFTNVTRKLAWHSGAGERERRLIEMWPSTYEDKHLKAQRRKVKTRDRLAGELTALQTQMTADLARLQHLKGTIPVCLYKSTGKVAVVDRSQRRATAIHERFHADIRRLETHNGLETFDRCLADASYDKLMALNNEAANAALRMSALYWAKAFPRASVEEVLARVEEINKSCTRSAKDCESTRLKMFEQLQMTRSKMPEALSLLATKVKEKYGGAKGLFHAAARGCKLRVMTVTGDRG